MIILITIGKLILRILYALMKLTPVRNRIVFLSRQYDQPSLDFIRLIASIREMSPETEILCLCMRMEKDPNAFMARRWKNLFFTLRQMKALAGAGTAVVDGYSIPISILRHKKSLSVIQIWHAVGAIKKAGLQTIGGKEASGRRVAKAMRMHANYSWAVSASGATANIYAEAFGLEPDHIALTGTPHLDYLFRRENDRVEDFRTRHPQTGDGRKLVAYIPTYREGSPTELKAFLDAFDYSRYHLLVRLHPKEADAKVRDRRVIYDEDFSADEILSAADFVVTDYSSVAIVAGLLDIPVFYYVYDIDAYRKNPGLNIDPMTRFPGCAAKDPKEIMAMIDAPYDRERQQAFLREYVSCFDGGCTQRLAEFILHPRRTDQVRGSTALRSGV